MALQYRSRVIRLSQGDLEVHDVGEGRPLVFLHGAFTDHTIWNDVVARMVPLGYRCLVPALPLGSHRLPMPRQADLSPSGLAELVADLISALDLAPATIISNDTATAVMQLVLTGRPDTVAAAVLTSGDAYEHFLPPAFVTLKALPYIPGGLQILGWVMRHPRLGRQRWAFGRLSTTGMSREQAGRWSAGLIRDPGVRRDVRTMIRGFHRRHTLGAAALFGTVNAPVRIVWGRDDQIFPVKLGSRLERDLPHADLHVLDHGRTYLQLDAAPELSELIHSFVQAVDRPTLPEATVSA